MRFESPAWFALLALIPLLVFVFAAGERKGAAGLERFAAKRLLPVLGRSAGWPRILRLVLILATIALLSVAMARPSYGYRLREIHGKGADVIFAIDISRSMLCTDVTPNRLTRAKLAARDMLDIARGHRMGVIPFTREAFLQCPLTLDQEIVAQSIDVLDINNLPKQGTSLAGPIAEARKAFQNSGNNKRILVILSDGEDLEGSGVAEARDTKDMTIVTIGTGTVQGAPVPVSAAPGAGYLRDKSDAPITSHLSPDDLKDVAEATGGFYAPAGSPAITALFRDAVNRDDRESNVEAANIRVPIIRYRWPLAAALALLVAEAFIPAFRRKGGAALLALFLFLPIAAPSPADAEEKAPQTFPAKTGPEPVKENGAKQPATPTSAKAKTVAPKGNPREPYNKGVQSFSDGDYEAAYADFEKAAALVSPETPDELKKQIHGNAGASKLAEAIALIPPAEEPMAKEDDASARKLLDAAKKEIEKALSIAPEDKLLKDNFKLIVDARAELDRHKPKPQVKKPEDKPKKPDEDEPKRKKPDPLPTPKHKDEPPPPSKGDDKKNDDNKGGGNDNSGGGKDKDNNQKSNSGNGNQQQNGGSGGGSGGGGGGSDQDPSQGAGGGGQNQQGGSGGNNQNQPQGGNQQQPQQPQENKPQQGPQNQPRQQPQSNSPQNQPSGGSKENQRGAQNPSLQPQEQPQKQNPQPQQKPEEKKPQGQDQNQPQQAPQPKQQAGQQEPQPQAQNGSQQPQPQPEEKQGGEQPKPQPQAGQDNQPQPQPQAGAQQPQNGGGQEPQPQTASNASQAPQPQPSGNGGQQPGASQGQAPQPQPQPGNQGTGGDEKKQGEGENPQPQPQPVPQPAPQPQPAPAPQADGEKKEAAPQPEPSGEKKENAPQPVSAGTEGNQAAAQQARAAAASAAEPKREGDHSASLAPKEAATPEQQETQTAAATTQAGTSSSEAEGTAQQSAVPAANGKMTSAQAEQLLKILQDDEKLLPAGQAKNQRPDDSSGRDW